MSNEIAALQVKAEADGVSQTADALDKLTDSAEKADKAVKNLGPDAEKAGKDVDKLGKSASAVEVAVARMTRMAIRAGAVLAGAFSVGAYARIADSWSDLQSVVGAATKDMDNAAATMQQLLRLANESYSPLDQTARGFAQNATILRELGFETQQMLDYTESLNHMLVINAAKGENAAVVQNALGRALATGKFQAQEFEVVMSRAPRVLEAIAAHMSVNVSELRKLGSEGKITSEIISGALLESLERVREEAGEMPTTIGDGFLKIQNGITAVIGSFDKAAGASEAVATRLNAVAEWLGVIAASDFAAVVDAATDALKGLAQILFVIAVTRIPALVIAVRAWGAAQGVTNVQTLAGVAASRAMAAAMAAQAGAARLLAGALAMVGGPIGLMIGSVTALGLHFHNQRQRARDLAETLSSLKGTYAALGDAMDGYFKNITEASLEAWRVQEQAHNAMLRTALGQAEKALADAGFYSNFFGKSLFETEAMREARDLIADIGGQLAESEARLSAIEGAQYRFTQAAAASKDEVVQLSDAQQKALDAANDMIAGYQRRAELARIEAQHGRDSAEYFAKQLQHERDITFARINALEISEDQKANARAQYDEMVKLEAATKGWLVEINSVNTELSSTYQALLKISETQPGDSWLDTAIRKAATLALNLWDAVAANNAVSAVQVDDAGNPIPPGVSRTRPQMRGVDSLGNWENARHGSVGGGGGGGLSDQYAANLQALIESLQTEQATIDAWYQSSMEILNDRRALEILGIEEHNALKEAIEAEHQKRLHELMYRAQSETLGHYGTLFGNMARIAEAGGDKLLGITKAFSIAEGLINSYRAYTQVLADPSLIGRPFLRTALAASTLASGLAQVANMRGVSKGGGGGGGAGSAAATQAAAPAPQTISIQGVDPRGLYTGQAIIDLTDAVQGELKNRGMVIQYV